MSYCSQCLHNSVHYCHYFSWTMFPKTVRIIETCHMPFLSPNFIYLSWNSTQGKTHIKKEAPVKTLSTATQQYEKSQLKRLIVSKQMTLKVTQHYDQPAYQIWSLYLHWLQRCEKAIKMWKMRWFGTAGILEVTENSTIQQHTFDFILAFLNDYVPVLHRFWDIAWYKSQITNFNLPY